MGGAHRWCFCLGPKLPGESCERRGDPQSPCLPQDYACLTHPCASLIVSLCLGSGEAEASESNMFQLQERFVQSLSSRPNLDLTDLKMSCPRASI